MVIMLHALLIWATPMAEKMFDLSDPDILESTILQMRFEGNPEIEVNDVRFCCGYDFFAMSYNYQGYSFKWNCEIPNVGDTLDATMKVSAILSEDEAALYSTVCLDCLKSYKSIECAINAVLATFSGQSSCYKDVQVNENVGSIKILCLKEDDYKLCPLVFTEVETNDKYIIVCCDIASISPQKFYKLKADANEECWIIDRDAPPVKYIDGTPLVEKVTNLIDYDQLIIQEE